LSDHVQWFTGLYDQYYRRVLRYALQHADPGSAEDVASETFLIAWRRLAEIPEPPLPWLLAVARNLLRQQFGRSRRQQRLADRIAALTSDADLQAWDAGEHVVERAAALDALGSLNDADVEALTLVTWHGLSAAEAAQVAGCSPHAFTVRLHRARGRLADALRRSDDRNPAHPRAARAAAGLDGRAPLIRLPQGNGR
jgi:RNA polymerase sigma-70 factor (ECF subfamily)